MKAIVVIPVYRSAMNEYEKLSFVQCCKVLGHYTICLITHSELDDSVYRHLASKKGVTLTRENFDKAYFEGIQGYNSLCLSRDLYARFADYDYMLLYQLDAYVFRNELDAWCKKGYDYIGAPIPLQYVHDFEQKVQTILPEAKVQLGMNGGLSLRKIAFFIQCFDEKSVLINQLRTLDNEDHIWSLLAEKVPTRSEALSFSFDARVKENYKETKHTLPCFCHGWSKGGASYAFSFWYRRIAPFRWFIWRINALVKLKK